MPTTLSFVVVLNSDDDDDEEEVAAELVFFFDFAFDFAVSDDEEAERSYSSSAPYTFL